ncbi:GNAT family acetyltransferase [Apiospora arundinis]|uniref:GNAT family acetyltransferase n=1 Tax=Apiospora arundinis TaxID=335852 RepID=A0ABR2HL42_9PEZI
MATTSDQLHMRVATRQDAPRIAEIHMAVFTQNALLHAMFPSPATRKAFRICLEDMALNDIEDPESTVLVVTTSSDDPEKNVRPIVAFAMWSLPVPPGKDEDDDEPDWKWPEGTDTELVEAWHAKTAEAERHAVGDTPCYQLSFIGTDHTFGIRGAGRMLLQWGIQQCNANKAPLYLESTVEAAPFYEKHGLVAGETISIPVRVDSGTEEKIYKEIVHTYFPA